MATKVSVIVPNYNHAEHLKRRLDTILLQTFRDFEVIILDDCSTDDSKTVISQYMFAPNVTKVVFNEINSGSPFKQWEKGLSFAQGEWIWIAESDDYADKHFLERMISAESRYTNKNIGLIYCDSKILQDDETWQETFANIKNRKYHSSRWSHDYFNAGQDEIEDYLLPNGTINNTSAVLFNREVLLRANPFDLPLRYIGDKYTFIKVLAISDILYVKEALNYYRDPFNKKHIDKYIFYFYEQFIVYNWVYKKTRLVNRKKFFQGFYKNTRNSLFREWDLTKVKLYGKLFYLNPGLMTKCVFHNFISAFHKGFRISE